ncbi:unnamed protein product [Effrenium voratum]|uniref:ATP-dependent RNA helicase DHX29 DSRM-like domain-containing protein n=1 Tax=Effrenium voratum TaxID=2562239 RepID=A0AA36IW51_9DINO|nr:unnamed protein product [Effrenium voratum]
MGAGGRCTPQRGAPKVGEESDPCRCCWPAGKKRRVPARRRGGAEQARGAEGGGGVGSSAGRGRASAPGAAEVLALQGKAHLGARQCHLCRPGGLQLQGRADPASHGQDRGLRRPGGAGVAAGEHPQAGAAAALRRGEFGGRPPAGAGGAGGGGRLRAAGPGGGALRRRGPAAGPGGGEAAAAEEAKAKASEPEKEKKEPPKEEKAPKEDKERPACDKEAGKDFARRWLEQYQDAEEEDALLSPEELLHLERKKDPTARYIKVFLQYEDAGKVLKALKEKKRRGAFKQNISADQQKQREAANKLLNCKSELELLESGKYGPLDQERIAQAKPKKAPKEEKENGKEQEKEVDEEKDEKKDADEEDPEMPSLFENGDEASPSEAEPKPQIRAFGLGSWTGRTPKEAMEDFVKKKFWGKHQGPLGRYTKIQVPAGGGHRARVTVQLPRNRRRRFDPEEPCETAKEAEHLAATLALMKLSEEADKPGLQRGLPPAYRQQWQEWEQQVAAEQQESAGRRWSRTRSSSWSDCCARSRQLCRRIWG